RQRHARGTAGAGRPLRAAVRAPPARARDRARPRQAGGRAPSRTGARIGLRRAGALTPLAARPGPVPDNPGMASPPPSPLAPPPPTPHRQGSKVTGFGLEEPKGASFAQRTGAAAPRSLQELVSSLRTPRVLLLMVPAGAPVDAVLGELRPLLVPGDVVIDGGN